MSHFDTLIHDDTLIFCQALGPNRQRMIEEVRIQYVSFHTRTREGTHLI
jgi:hypothetical protein